MGTMGSELAKVVAANVRAEAARRGLTQYELAKRIGLAQSAVSDRYRERRQWQLEDLEELGNLFGIEPAELLVRPKGFEPLTFWLGSNHTIMEFDTEGWFFCDLCGERGAGLLGGHHQFGFHGEMDLEVRAASHQPISAPG